MKKLCKIIGMSLLGLGFLIGCKGSDNSGFVNLDGVVINEEYREGGAGITGIDELYTIRIKTYYGEKEVRIHSAVFGDSKKRENLMRLNDKLNPGSKVRIRILRRNLPLKVLSIYSYHVFPQNRESQ